MIFFVYLIKRVCYAKAKWHKAYNNHSWTYAPLRTGAPNTNDSPPYVAASGLLRNFFSRQPFYISKDKNFTTLYWQMFQQFIQMAIEVFNRKLLNNRIVAFQQILISSKYFS